MTPQSRAIPGRARPAARAAAAALIAATLLACNTTDLLKVPDPDVVRPGQLANKGSLPNAFAATIGDFQVAFSGSGGDEGQAQMTGLFTDELINAESFPTRIEVDMRNVNPVNATMLIIFRDLERARATAEATEDAYARLDPTNPSRAEVLALDGYTYVLFAENYCSGVPYTIANADGSFTYGAPQTTAQTLATAVAKFDSAIALATAAAAAGNGGTTQLYLAKVGEARALLDEGNFTAAAAMANGVPTGFRYQILHDENSSRQYSGIFSFAQNARRFSIPDREGTNGQPFRSLNDPRAPVRRNSAARGLGFDNITPLYVTAKYPNRSAPTTVGDGVEARLIEAEAALQNGNDVGLLTNLNAARAAAPTYAVPPASPPPGPAPIAALPTTYSAKVDLLFQERALDLFLTSHRLGDLRRLVRQYGRGAETVFPTGAYFKGGTYGTEVNLPIPFEELNNPKFKGCLDTNA